MTVELTAEDVRAALCAKLGTEDLAVDSFQLVSLMEDGRLGYLGDHFRVKCSVRQPAAAEPRAVSMFVKGLPRNPMARATVVNSGAFRKEALFYQCVAKGIKEAVAEDRGPDFQPFVYPACHLIKDDCILLDDLGPFGFTGIEDGRNGLPLEHVKLVVKALAEIHAGSLVLEERAGGRSIVEQHPEFDFESFFSDDPSHSQQGWHRASIKVCVALVPHMDKYRGDPALVARVQAALPPLLLQLFAQMRPWPGVRNAVCHGDVWVNNFMFRAGADGQPVEVSLVDFQLARYMPPAHDLVMMLTFCTDAAFWDAHLDELARLHWDTMAAALRRAGCDPDKVLPWSEYSDVLQRTWKFGLVQMALEYPFSLAPAWLMGPLLEDPEKFQHHCNVDRTDAILGLYRDDPLFRARYTELMERLIDGHILNAA